MSNIIVITMRIGLNLLFLIPSVVGGTETYSTSLIDALQELDSSNLYFIFINNETRDLNLPIGINFQKIICPINARNRFSRFLWEQFILPWQALYLKLDVMHSLGYIGPLFLPCKSVVTIHDLNFIFVPESFTFFTRLIQRLFVTCTANKADQIIADSAFIKNQIIEYLDIPKERITVIHAAPKKRITKATDPAIWNDLQRKYDLNRHYIIAFSSYAPHKNIPRLVEAFAIIKKQTINYKLVIVGNQPTKGKSLASFAESMGLENEVVFTGYLQDEQIASLLSHAELFIFPSLYEGFGLPALEAMAVGTAVACSYSGSLPEIVGNAAVFFDPLDITNMAHVITSILNDYSKVVSLRELGRENLKRFSWEMASYKTVDVYHRYTI